MILHEVAGGFKNNLVLCIQLLLRNSDQQELLSTSARSPWVCLSLNMAVVGLFKPQLGLPSSLLKLNKDFVFLNRAIDGVFES